MSTDEQKSRKKKTKKDEFTTEDLHGSGGGIGSEDLHGSDAEAKDLHGSGEPAK